MVPPVRKFNSVLAAMAGIAIISGASTGRADIYNIDAVHSSVVFKIKHLNTSNFYGRFNDVSGKIELDENDPSKSSVEFTIKTDSVDTNNEKRDQHVKGPDFLNTKQFPTITFKSTKVAKSGDNKYAVEGEVEMHGEKKPLSVTVEQVGSGKDMKGSDIIGAETKFTVKRSNFGMSGMQKALGDDIDVIVSVEAGKAGAAEAK